MSMVAASLWCASMGNAHFNEVATFTLPPAGPGQRMSFDFWLVWVLLRISNEDLLATLDYPPPALHSGSPRIAARMLGGGFDDWRFPRIDLRRMGRDG